MSRPVAGDRTADTAVATISQGAHFLQISRGSLYSLIRRGEIDSLKVGRVRRIPWESLRAFIARQTQQGREMVSAAGEPALTTCK